MTRCVVTCIYAPNERLEEGAFASLVATSEEFPDAVKLACCDCVTPRLLAVCEVYGWRLVYPTAPAAPRMKHLLELASAACPDADVYWIIEHDSLIKHGVSSDVEQYFDQYRGVGLIEAPSTDTDGAPNYPSSFKRYEDYAGRHPKLRRQFPWSSLNCIAVRGDAWRMLEWYRIREYPITDQDVHAQLVEDGWDICAVPDATCYHLATWSRKALPVPAGRRPPKAETHRPYKLGVVLPVRNEGQEPLLTVRDFRASKEDTTDLRFAVIDDGSTDGCCDIFARAQDITMERNAEPRGEAKARNRGAELLREHQPDALFWFDAHERMLTHGGLEKMATLAIEKQALVCCICRNSEAKGPDPERAGARWAWSTDGSNPKKPPGLRLNWAYHSAGPIRYVSVDAVLGACYCVPTPLWQSLGPWLDECGLYGFGEQALCIKAWFLEIPRLCRTDVQASHKFRVARPYQMSGSYFWQSMAGATRILFSDAIWRAHFWPIIQQIAGGDPVVREIESSAQIALRRDVFATQKRRTDEECLAWLGIT